jgi:hypothetical protein
VPSKSVGAIDVDKSGYVSRDDDTDDPDGQGSDRKGSDSDAYYPGEDDADGQGSERKGSDSDSQDPANRRPRPTPWSFLTFFSSCLSTSAPPGGAWRADFKSIYGRNFGVRLLTQIVFLLL